MSSRKPKSEPELPQGHPERGDTIRIRTLRTISTADEYIRAFERIDSWMAGQQWDMLRAQYHAPDRIVSATGLCSMFGIPLQTVNLMYGTLGRKLGDALGIVPDLRKNGKPRWWMVLSSGWRSGDRYLWRMHWELAEALEQMGVPGNDIDVESGPEKGMKRKPLMEGAVQSVSLNIYERNKVARRRCLEHYGTDCRICGFNFGREYGPEAEGMIHVHHIRPLSNIGDVYEVDPVRDLIPVCPNCHAVIHRRAEPYSVEEVRKMLRKSES